LLPVLVGIDWCSHLIVGNCFEDPSLNVASDEPTCLLGEPVNWIFTVDSLPVEWVEFVLTMLQNRKWIVTAHSFDHLQMTENSVVADRLERSCIVRKS